MHQFLIFRRFHEFVPSNKNTHSLITAETTFLALGIFIAEIIWRQTVPVASYKYWVRLSKVHKVIWPKSTEKMDIFIFRYYFYMV